MLLAHASVSESAWAFHAHPDVWLVVAGLGAAYWWAVRRTPAGEAPVTRRQATLFSLGLLALWVHSDWPVHDLAEDHLLFVHMVQHTGFQLIAAPLLLLGLPAWLFRRLFGGWRALRFLARPLVAGLLFNLLVVLAHWPVVVNATLESEPLHFGVHTLLFGSAVLMWLPVLNLGRAPGLPQLGDAGRMLYLFLQSVLPTVPASFLTFAERPIYRFYAEAPRVFGMSAVDDQQVAGALMKVYAGSLLWGVILVMFFRWYARDQRAGVAQRPDVLTWDDVEREFERSPAPSSPR